MRTTRPAFRNAAARALAAVAVLMLVGCATDAPKLQLDPTLVSYSRKDFAKGPIRLPANYSAEKFRKLQLGVSFEAVEGIDRKTGAPLAVDPALAARLQTEMAKLKRFTVFSAHNRGGVAFFEALQDVEGDSVRVREPVDARMIDFVLNGRLTVTKERQDLYNETLLIYEVECDFSCEDLRTRTVRFAEKARGRTARRQILSYSGRALAGMDTADERQAITEAALKALAVVANKLGNTFPVGGRIVSATTTGDKMTLSAGFEEGIGQAQQCVVFMDDGGVDVALAMAEAVPKANGTSRLEVYRWNTGDRDAAPLVKAYRSNPRGFLAENRVFAVGYGLSVPPEWESEYRDSADESARLGH